MPDKPKMTDEQIRDAVEGARVAVNPVPELVEAFMKGTETENHADTKSSS